MTLERFSPDYEWDTGPKMETPNRSSASPTCYQVLLGGDFLGTKDKDFRAFVEQMPDTHWAKYDLSAVRLGWEAHKLFST